MNRRAPSSLRRHLLAAASATAISLGLGSLPTPALAQAPTFPPPQGVKLLVPYPAGGATDILARMMAQKLGDAWKVPVIVENRPGAGGTIGAQAVVKAAPDGTYGAGTSSHIQGSLLNLQGGLDMVHVPYQGGAPLVNAMLGHQLSSAFLDAGSSRPHLPKFKLLGTTGPSRLAWLPDVPTLKEQGLTGFEPMGWFGMLLPAATPRAIVERVSAESVRILRLPEIREKIESMGLIPAADTPEQFADSMRSDAAVYARIIQDAGIKLN